MQDKKRIEELRLILNQHNINYYVHDNPTISDYEYDQLLKKLQNLEDKNQFNDQLSNPRTTPL